MNTISNINKTGESATLELISQRACREKTLATYTMILWKFVQSNNFKVNSSLLFEGEENLL